MKKAYSEPKLKKISEFEYSLKTLTNYSIERHYEPAHDFSVKSLYSLDFSKEKPEFKETDLNIPPFLDISELKTLYAAGVKPK